MADTEQLEHDVRRLEKKLAEAEEAIGAVFRRCDSIRADLEKRISDLEQVVAVLANRGI